MNVLIIEDDEVVATWLAKFLREVAENVVVAHSLQAGIQHIATQDPPFDVISLDLGLPDSLPHETIESIRSIKQKSPDCLLVVLTGYRQDEYRKNSMKSGADAFFDKSDSIMDDCQGLLSSLYDSCVRIMSGKKSYSGNVAKLEFIAKTLCARNRKITPQKA